MEVQQIKLEDIHPYPENAKQHPPEQIDKIALSIKEFGFNQPVVLDRENIIIVGHGRFEAAQLLNLKTIPAIHVDLTAEQAKAYRLADNKLNESEWEMDKVLQEIKALEEADFDISLTGFSKEELQQFESASVEEQGQLDQKTSESLTCPECGHIWNPSSK